MFGHRSDGKKVKNLEPIFRVVPFIMMERNDAQVLFKQDIPISKMTEYINKKAEEGIRLSYMHIIYAAIVKILEERDQLNRFVVNGTIYQRNKIYVSLVIKKNMSDEGEETVTKLEFDGTENIFEVKEKLDKIIEENKEVTAQNNTDKIIKLFNLIPNGILIWIIKFLKFLDKHGIMPKSIIALSPFHTSVFLTNVGSLGIDSIYHHIYNFGTTSMFFSMGKKKKSYIYEEDEIREEKCITIGFVGDERICDGFYYANSFKQMVKYLKKPELLEGDIAKNANKEETIKN
ncbi:MAG: 2-oxo acid dehydrogenase subunit E2 [Clostridia bacterium]|nr:2-oxo acid dehydrogenase subunit E2 [Clostridia bacterium]